VIVFRKNGLWPFSGFCAQNGIREFSGNRSEVLFWEFRIFLGFLYFCVFMRSFWHWNFFRKNIIVKIAIVRKLIPNFYFPEKWLQKIHRNWGIFGSFAWSGFHRFWHGFKNVHAHWLSLVSLVVDCWDVLLPLL
jgi:hypothetical protein